MPEQELDLLQFSTGEMAQAGATAPEVMGSKVGDAGLRAAPFITCRTAFGVMCSLHVVPIRLTARR